MGEKEAGRLTMNCFTIVIAIAMLFGGAGTIV
jgi:hypothetical protein